MHGKVLARQAGKLHLLSSRRACLQLAGVTSQTQYSFCSRLKCHWTYYMFKTLHCFILAEQESLFVSIVLSFSLHKMLTSQSVHNIHRRMFSHSVTSCEAVQLPCDYFAVICNTFPLTVQFLTVAMLKGIAILLTVLQGCDPVNCWSQLYCAVY